MAYVANCRDESSLRLGGIFNQKNQVLLSKKKKKSLKKNSLMEKQILEWHISCLLIWESWYLGANVKWFIYLFYFSL